MWLVFGIGAMLSALLNIIWTVKCKDARWFRFASLSLTALTLCGFYNQVRQWVLVGDWSALMDVVPFTATALWFLTIASILINGVSLFQKNK